MGAPRQEMNIVSGGGQTGAEIPADTAGGHDCNAHSKFAFVFLVLVAWGYAPGLTCL